LPVGYRWYVVAAKTKAKQAKHATMVGARLRQLREIQTSPLLHGVRPAAPTTGGSFHFVRPILTSVQNSHRDDLPTDGELKPPQKKTLMIGSENPIKKKNRNWDLKKKTGSENTKPNISRKYVHHQARSTSLFSGLQNGSRRTHIS